MTGNGADRPHGRQSFFGSIYAVPLFLAAVIFFSHMFTAGNYGIFRDEYYYIACGEHLDFGYVDHPPLIAVVTRLVTSILGRSVHAIRLLPALAGAITVLLTAALVKELGGGRFAAALAGLSVLANATLMAVFGMLAMNAFDVLLVCACMLLLARLINGADPRLWIAFGVVAGIGLQNKMTMLIVGFATVASLLLTRQRKLLASPWPYVGGAIAALIFLPHVLWQIANGWPTLEFISNAQQYKIAPTDPPGFALQMLIGFNPATALVWLAGLGYLLLSSKPAQHRPLALVFLVSLAVFVVQGSKYYYISPLLPVLLAGGAVAWEAAAQKLKRNGSLALRGAVAACLVIPALVFLPMSIPLLPIDSFVDYYNLVGLGKAVKTERQFGDTLPQHFSDRFGWPQMAESVARVYGSLPAAERAEAVILAGNYGEAGAFDYHRSALGLPPVICRHNSYWLWGTQGASGEVVIAVGYSQQHMQEYFGSVAEAARHHNAYAMSYETDLPILVCREPLLPLEQIWQHLKIFI